MSDTFFANAVRRDYGRVAERYERRWRMFNAVVREWVLERWPDEFREHGRVLDLGCGTGAFLGRIAECFPALELTGLDLTPALLAEARRRAPTARLIEGNAEAPPFAARSFDVVCSLNVLHHLIDRRRHLGLLAELCRPGGTAFLCTFAGGRTLGMRLLTRWLEKRNAGWRRTLTPAELKRMLGSEPRLAVHEHDELRAGVWRLQIYRLLVVEATS